MRIYDTYHCLITLYPYIIGFLIQPIICIIPIDFYYVYLLHFSITLRIVLTIICVCVVQCTTDIHRMSYIVEITVYNSAYGVQVVVVHGVHCTDISHFTIYYLPIIHHNINVYYGYIHCSMYNIRCQCTVYNAHRTVYSVQCTVYSVQCTVLCVSQYMIV